MDNNQFTSPQPKAKRMIKPIIIGLVVVLVVGGLIIYGFKIWPQPANSPAKKDSSQSPTVTPAKTRPAAVDSNRHVLSADIKFDTTEQGDCTLTISNKNYTKTYVNSTKGLKGFTGCLNWGIDTKTIPAGDYDVKATFKGETQTLNYTQKLTVK